MFVPSSVCPLAFLSFDFFVWICPSYACIIVCSLFSYYKPITRRQILDSSKLKELADNNFKFDENGRKLSKQVENTVGIARYEQFLLFPQCFQKACFPGASKGVIVWEWVNPFPNKPWLLRVCSTSLLKTLWEKEKLLVTSSHWFSHSVFYPFDKLSAIFIKLKIVVCKLFHFGRV